MADAAGEIGANAFDKVGKLNGLGSGEPLDCFGGQRIGGGANAVQQFGGARRKVELPRAAVGGIGAAFDQLGLDQSIDHPRQGDRLDLDQFGKRTLVDTLVAFEVSDQPPLQRRDPAFLGARVERAPEQARGVIQQESDRFTHVIRYNSNCYYIQQRCGIANSLEYGVNFLYTACVGHVFGQDVGMTFTADLFWSFRSPYSYLAIGRYRALAASHDVTINLRPVYPLAVRQPDFFERNHPNWLSYTMRDMIRVAQFHGIPFGPPRPDPIVQNIMTREIAAEQPYIYRLTRMGQAAARRGKGVAFAHEVGQLIWGGAQDWHLGEHLAGAAKRAGLDLAELDAEAASEAEALDTEIAANQVALEIAGHWGVPTLVVDGEPFFGQDRIEMAKWRMEQKGLRPR